MNAIVTGCAGFIGSHFCERLLGEGYTVIGIDNFDSFYNTDLKKQNLKTFKDHPSFTFFERNLRECPLEDLPWNGATLVHFAASAGVRPSVGSALTYVENNIGVTTRLLEFAQTKGAKGVVIASSSSIYGNEDAGPKGFSETTTTDYPISPYAATKKACELMAHTFYVNFGLPVVCLRLFSAYGPRQRPDLAISKFMGLIMRGEPISLYGDGTMRRDFTYVGDLVDGIFAAMTRGLTYGFRIYNLGNGKTVEVMTLVKKIEEVMKAKKLLIQFKDVPKGDVAVTHACISLAKAELDYVPKTDLDEGLLAQWEWFSAQFFHDKDAALPLSQ